MSPAQAPSGPRVRVEDLESGAVRRLRMNGGKGNVLDSALVGDLTAAFREAASSPDLKAVLLEAEGPHFSYGASVEEHRPRKVESMLKAFHGLLRAMLESAVPVAAAVRGSCLGGGLEVVLMAHRVFAAPDARLGQPEITLGVFAPAASVLLPGRVGRGAAEDLLLTGRVVDAAEALRTGLVDEVAADPSEAALAWARRHLLPKSASSLRFAVRAARIALERAFLPDLEAAERLYLEGLVPTADASEGLEAFLVRRPPVWRNA